MKLSNIFLSSESKVWGIWGAVVLASFLIQWPTLRISPPVWQDEVQILDYGRVELGGDLRYGLNLAMDGNRMRRVELLCCEIH